MAFCGFFELVVNTDALPPKAAAPPMTFWMSKGIKLDPAALPLARRPSDSTGALPVVNGQSTGIGFWGCAQIRASLCLESALEGQLGLRISSGDG